jgi:hypothetical protein
MSLSASGPFLGSLAVPKPLLSLSSFLGLCSSLYLPPQPFPYHVPTSRAWAFKHIVGRAKFLNKSKILKGVMLILKHELTRR